MDACPQGGRAGGDGRPLPVVHDGTGDLHHGQDKRTSPAVLHDGTPQASGSRRKGMQARTRMNARSRPRQGHRKLIPGTKKTPSRCELQGGLERSLAAAYFPT